MGDREELPPGRAEERAVPPPALVLLAKECDERAEQGELLDPILAHQALAEIKDVHARFTWGGSSPGVACAMMDRLVGARFHFGLSLTIRSDILGGVPLSGPTRPSPRRATSRGGPACGRTFSCG